jgi:ribosomal protein S12 methylthiotransferase accessory factor
MTVRPSLAGGTADSILRLRAALGQADCAPLHGLDWVAVLPNAAAPGFVYLAGACGGVPVGGGGRDLAEAAVRLAGETAEVLAQAAGTVACDLPGDPAIDALWIDGTGPARIPATHLASGRPIGVPAAAVHPAEPRSAGAPPPSLGLAAGTDVAAARLAGLLELIERDAAAAWWNDGAPARALDAAVAADAAAGLAAMRAGRTGRATAFLELASPTGVPVVCAVSRDAKGGLAFGLKAAPDPRAAASGAMIELLQMEIALEMARLRGARGDAGPLARAALDPDALPALAAGPARPLSPVGAATFDDLTADLTRTGLDITVADLPVPPDGWPVSKVLAPGLRPLPGDPRPPHPDAPGARAPLM